MSRPNKPRRVPLLCYVTDRRSLAIAAPAEEPQRFNACRILLQKIAEAAEAGVDWIQIREKDLSGKEQSSLAREAVHSAANSASRILINNRLDVALATQANGVHLGEESLPPQEALRLAKSLSREKHFLVGVSCHSLEAAKVAERNRPDYIFFGPVFATPSKAGYGAPQGVDRLAEVCCALSIPVLAIGGITLDNALACISAGASGVAAIRLFQDAPNIAELTRELRRVSA